MAEKDEGVVQKKTWKVSKSRGATGRIVTSSDI